MRNLFLALREIVWPAVIALLLAVAAIVVALTSTLNLDLVFALASGSVTMAILAQRV
jgi:hypothetical protein